MSLHRQNSLIIADQAELLAELFEYFEFANPAICPKRREFLESIGQCLGFEDKWIDKAIATKDA